QAGQSTRPWYGFGVVGPRQMPSVLLPLLPGAARATTTAGSSRTWRVSTWTAIGGGCWTVTPLRSGRAVTFRLTAEPGSARVASTEATRLLESTRLITSARPEYVTVVLVGGLIRMMFGGTV